MSVSISWKPIDEKKNYFSRGTSKNLDVLINCFTHRINSSDISGLRLLAKATGDSFYDDVADVIETVGAIEVDGVN